MGSSDLFKFDLGAEISVTDFRKEDLLTEALHAHHRLRVRRRNEIVGVLLGADEWRTLEAFTHEIQGRLAEAERRLEEADERAEEAAVQAIISARAPNAKPVRGTPESVLEIERALEQLGI